MAYSVLLYCPDRHLRYDVRTPDRKGVGGGVTARLRLATALAGIGCRVTLLANVPRRERHGRLELVPLDAARPLRVDVAIFNSTGGALHLGGAVSLGVEAQLRLVWIGGTARVGGLDVVGWDAVVAPSNYVRHALDSWGVPPARRWVVPNGVPEVSWRWPFRRRDPRRLVYTSHPDKGLGPALALLERLRRHDARFHLELYGGSALWGQPEVAPPALPGVSWHGMVGQRRLGRALERAGISLHLQDMPEGYGIALAEAMAHGCVVFASSVGAFPEAVDHGVDGYLFDGPAGDATVLDAAAATAVQLAADPARSDALGSRARRAPVTWRTVAEGWVGRFDRALRAEAGGAAGPCPECGGDGYRYADGWQCGACGNWSRRRGAP
jgi:glycosyltransferase involved in cell wall biosynthesis